MTEQHTRAFRVTLAGAKDGIDGDDIETILTNSGYGLGDVAVTELAAPVGADVPAGDAGLVARINERLAKVDAQLASNKYNHDWLEGQKKAYLLALNDARHERRAEGPGVTLDGLVQPIESLHPSWWQLEFGPTPKHWTQSQPHRATVTVYDAAGKRFSASSDGSSRERAVASAIALIDIDVRTSAKIAAADAERGAGGV